MKIYIFIIPLIFFFFLHQQTDTSIIQGKVLFKDSNGIELPVDEVRVYFEKYNIETFTDSLGLFFLEMRTTVFKDTTDLIIEKEGYITKSISEFPIAFMQNRQYQFILTKRVIINCPITQKLK